MKNTLTVSTPFDPVKRTIDFSAVPNFDIRRLYLVFNETANALLYLKSGAGLGIAGAVSPAGLVSLAASGAVFLGMLPTDTIAILYDGPDTAAQDATLQAIKALLGAAPAQTADIAAVKTALGTPAQATDVQAVVTRLGTAPAQDATLQAIKALLGAAPAQTTDVAAVKTALGAPAQSTDVQAVVTRLGTAPAQTADIAAIVAKLGTLLTVDSTQDRPFATAAILADTVAATAARSVGIYCTAAGDITFTLAGGGTITVPALAGWQTWPFAVTKSTFGAGTAGTVYNLS